MFFGSSSYDTVVINSFLPLETKKDWKKALNIRICCPHTQVEDFKKIADMSF